jgi:hypothetical protein
VRQTGNFGSDGLSRHSQEALRALIEAKLRGLPVKPREVITPPMIDLMVALKRSLTREMPATGGTTAKERRANQQPIGAVAASARRRRPKKEERDPDRAARCRCEAAEEDVSAAIIRLRTLLPSAPGLVLDPITPTSRQLSSSRRSFILATPLLLLPLRSGAIPRPDSDRGRAPRRTAGARSGGLISDSNQGRIMRAARSTPT